MYKRKIDTVEVKKSQSNERVYALPTHPHGGYSWHDVRSTFCILMTIHDDEWSLFSVVN